MGLVNITQGGANSYFEPTRGSTIGASFNSFFGAGAGSSSLGDGNTFVGTSSGSINRAGYTNTIVEVRADVGSVSLNNATPSARMQ